MVIFYMFYNININNLNRVKNTYMKKIILYILLTIVPEKDYPVKSPHIVEVEHRIIL